MKKNIKILVSLLILFLVFTNLNAKENSVVKDVKKALSSYAGMAELKKRGFNIKSMDNLESLEEIYNYLYPYMVQDGISLDNTISFYDKKSYRTFNFKQHYTVQFTDDYGTKAELAAKGYKENEIFAYFSKGTDVYRGGKFIWEKQKSFPEFGEWNIKQFPPISGENFIYFYPLYYTEKFYTDYWKQASSKDFIILDLRLHSGGDYPISLFFDYLDDVKYQGKLIIIIDSSSTAGEYLLEYRMTKWQNGQEVPRSFTFTTIGENTPGFGNFNGEWKRIESDNLIIWGIRPNVNKWKKYDEGVGIMPDIWAENSEDIFKTIEIFTGIKNFSSYVSTYQKYISLYSEVNDNYLLKLPPTIYKTSDEKCYMENLEQYINLIEKYIRNFIFFKAQNFYTFDIPESFNHIDDYKVYLDYLSKLLDIQTKWYDFCYANIEKRSAIHKSSLNKIWNKAKGLSAEEYLQELEISVEKSITVSEKDLKDITDNDYLDLLASKVKFADDVKTPNRRLEGVFLLFNKLDILQREGFDLHKMDYMTKPEEIINYLQPFFLSPEGYPRDLHTNINISTKDGKYYSVRQTSRYIVFNDEYGTKAQLAKKGYKENETMFYYPYHDGKFWKGQKDWRTGKQIMAFPNYQYEQTEWALKYYTTDKSVYFKFRNFPHPLNGGPKIEDDELQEMIDRLALETDKENVIFDISKNTGGDSFTSQKISEAVQKSGIKNVYIVIDKGAFSCGDHFPLCAKDFYFKQQNVTLIGYPTMGGTGSGDGETYIINFPDFQIEADIATSFQNSETEHEGWGATPDVYADTLEDALGAVKALTGDNKILPFESEQRKQRNKTQKRWLINDTIYEIE